MMDNTEFIWGTFDTGFMNRFSLRKQTSETIEREKIAAVAAALIAHEEGRQAVYIGHHASQSSDTLWRRAGRMRATRGRW